MDHGTQFAKWMELRAKTDRQLAALLSRTLASGVRLARQAAESGAPEPLARATRAYQEAQRLLPCLGETEAAARRPIERELVRLRRLLKEHELAATHAGAAC